MYHQYTDVTKVVQENMRKYILPLFMYRILLVTTEVNSPITHNNLCIEFTFLNNGGGY